MRLALKALRAQQQVTTAPLHSLAEALVIHDESCSEQISPPISPMHISLKEIFYLDIFSSRYSSTCLLGLQKALTELTSLPHTVFFTPAKAHDVQGQNQTIRIEVTTLLLTSLVPHMWVSSAGLSFLIIHLPQMLGRFVILIHFQGYTNINYYDYFLNLPPLLFYVSWKLPDGDHTYETLFIGFGVHVTKKGSLWWGLTTGLDFLPGLGPGWMTCPWVCEAYTSHRGRDSMEFPDSWQCGL